MKALNALTVQKCCDRALAPKFFWGTEMRGALHHAEKAQGRTAPVGRFCRSISAMPQSFAGVLPALLGKEWGEQCGTLREVGVLHARIGNKTDPNSPRRDSAVAAVQNTADQVLAWQKSTIGIGLEHISIQVSRTCTHVRSMHGQQSIITCSVEALASQAQIWHSRSCVRAV